MKRQGRLKALYRTASGLRFVLRLIASSRQRTTRRVSLKARPLDERIPDPRHFRLGHLLSRGSRAGRESDV
jgi:hypothetical protein